MIQADLQGHARANLEKFMGKTANCENGNEQHEVQGIYTKFLGFEKEHKSTVPEVRTYLTISVCCINERRMSPHLIIMDKFVLLGVIL
jgi:hypothetical protein